MRSLYNLACLCAKSLQTCLTLCEPMDCSLQTPLSTGFSKQEYWSGLPCPPPGDLSNSGIEPTTLMASALAPAPQYEINTHILLKRILKIIMACLRSPNKLAVKPKTQLKT